MRLYEIIQLDPNNTRHYVDNPFSSSKINQLMFHGGRKNIRKFNRPQEGVWFSDIESWAETYTQDGRGAIYPCWLNVKNPYTPTWDENDEYYGAMDIIGEFFTRLKQQGYDCYIQGGESGSIAVFDTVQIVNATTGKNM